MAVRSGNQAACKTKSLKKSSCSMKLSIIISSELINIIVVVILVLSCLFEARRERPGVSWVMVSRQNLFLLLFLFPSPQKHEPDVLYTESFVLDSVSACLFLNEIFVVKIALLTFFLSSDDLTFTLILDIFASLH